MSARAQAAWLCAVVSHLGLILLLLAWIAWIAPPAPGLVAPLLLLATGPLALGLRGLLHGRRYTAAWLSLLSMGYFVHGVAAWTPTAPQGWLAGAEVVFSLGLFGGGVVYVRLTRGDGTPG